MAIFDDNLNSLLKQLDAAGVSTKRFRDEIERAQKAGESLDEIMLNMQSRLETANRSMRGFTSSASSLNGILKANLAELSKSNSAINEGKKGYRQLTSIVSKLAESEDGIYQLQVKQLKSLNEKAQVSLKEVKSAANRLTVQRGLHKLEGEQLARSAERMLAAGSITEEEAALLRAKASNFEFETKAAAEAQHRLNIEKNLNSQLGVTGAALSSLGKLASKIGLSKFADDLENITEKLQNDMRVKTRQAAEEQLSLTNQTYKTARKEVATLQQRIDNGEKLSRDDKERLNTSLDTLETYEDQVKTLQAQVKASGGLLLKFKALGQAAAEFGKQLLDPLFIIGALVKNYIELDKASVDFQRLTGQNAKALGGQNDSLVTSVETLETMTALSEELGLNVNGIFSPKEMGQLAKSAKMLGLNTQQATNLGKRLTSNVRNVNDFENLVDQGADSFTTSTGKAVNLGQVLRGVSDTSDAIALSLGNNPKRLGEAVAGAQALGMSLGRVDQIAGSLMDFESSINNELEAQLLTGGQINLGKARELALNNDLAGLTKEIANNNALSESFGKANRIQQESMAKALGMSRDELAKMIILQKVQKGLSNEEIARQQNMTPEMVKQITAQEKLNTAVAKLGQSLAPFIDALVPIIDMITPIISGFSSMAAKASEVGVMLRESFGSAADSEGFKRVGKVLAAFTGGALVLRGINKMTLGTRFNPMVVKDVNSPGLFKGLTDNFKNLFKRSGVVKDKSLSTGYRDIATGQARSAKQASTASKAAKATRITAAKGLGKTLLRGSGIMSAIGASMDLVSNLGTAAQNEDVSVGDAMLRTLDQNKFMALGAAIGSIVPGVGTVIGAGIGGILDMVNSSTLGEKGMLTDSLEQQPTPMATGGIVTQPINAIVGEAGSEAVIPLREFYAKMDELINVVRQGGDVYMDGNKVGESLMLASTKLS